MRFGACIPHYAGGLSNKSAISDFCELAERLQYHSVWTTDHIAVPKKKPNPYGSIIESLVTLTYAAARTKTVKLGTSIIVLPLRQPVLFAKQVTSIDVLSEGRVILGVGAGWMEQEFETLNSNFRERGEKMNEQIRLLRTLWANENPQFEGHFFKVTDAISLPRPIQQCGPPIWIGGDSDAALKRVAELGDGWHPSGLTPGQISEGRQKLESLKPSRGEIVVSVRMPVEISENAPETYTWNSRQLHRIAGSPDKIIKEVEAYEEAGVEHLVCAFGTKSYEFASSQASLFAKEITPSFNT